MFAATPDQDLLEDATARFLEATYPISRIRELADRATTSDPDVWRQGAALGWTSFLVPEAAGGGSVSGNGVADLLVVSALFGHHAAPGPLLGTNVVAAALGRWGDADQQAGPLADLLSGEVTAAWGHATTAAAPGGRRCRVQARTRGGDLVLTGRVGTVEGAAEAAHLLVTADGDHGATQVLVPLDALGVVLSPLRGVDLTRRYHEVVLHDVGLPASSVVGEPGGAEGRGAELADLLGTMLLGEMVGATARALATTLEWTRDRYSFGRPLGSYQAIKHRVADMRTQLEASEAAAARAAQAVGEGAPDAHASVLAGTAYVAERAPEIVQECVQLHGGIGVTYELDLHLFLRRVVVDARLYGSSAEAARRLGALVVAEREAS